MATVIADILELLPTIKEERGTVKELTRHFLVTGLANASSDYQVLDEALAASGVPVYGDEAPGNAELVCANRTADPVRDSTTNVYVHCHYIWVGGLVFLPDSGVQYTGGGGLSQRDEQNDIFGNPITVTYSYPSADYKNHSQNPDLQGTTKTKGATNHPLRPQPTLNATFELTIFNPMVIQILLQGAVNTYPWAMGGAREWICQQMDWEQILSTGAVPRWRFKGQFQWNERTWEDQVFYTDDVDGSIPSDLTTNDSAPLSVAWPYAYRSVDFGYYFPV